ncbi:MAG: hypothetical protein ACRC1K_18475 [Planctomycetia bacterium]
MEIEWPPFQPGDRLLDRPATESDVGAGRAAFVLRDDAGRLIGSAVRMGMPRLGFAPEGDDRKLGVAIQVETDGERIVVGVRHEGGSFSVCSASEFDSAPRFLVFHRKPGFGIDQAERALATGRGKRLKRARRGDVLAVRWKTGPVLFIRHAAGDAVAQEIALLGDTPHADGLAGCDSLFEISFVDLDEVLDESISLLDVQWTFADELAGGFEYLDWNRTLTPLGEG